ncbi:preprotein translocase subunit SecG [Arsenophonus endosymbiont of Bemisia tabaci Asia II 3]|nr:preprotein translocase subunit SecG [Arsenophonus endosymbiont of Bemisia tabaci Asia II 3]
MYTTLLVIFLLVSIALIGMVMLQQGKSADMGASFGAGASATLFGLSGSGNFMTRITAIFATLFFVISLILANLTANKCVTGSNWENIGEPVKVEKPVEVPTAPVTPTSGIPH